MDNETLSAFQTFVLSDLKVTHPIPIILCDKLTKMTPEERLESLSKCYQLLALTYTSIDDIVDSYLDTWNIRNIKKEQRQTLCLWVSYFLSLSIENEETQTQGQDC